MLPVFPPISLFFFLFFFSFSYFSFVLSYSLLTRARVCYYHRLLFTPIRSATLAASVSFAISCGFISLGNCQRSAASFVMDGASLLQTFVFVASLWRRIGGSEKAASQAEREDPRPRSSRSSCSRKRASNPPTAEKKKKLYWTL